MILLCMAGGACVAGGHAWLGGHAWQGGVHDRGMCMARETATAADGTHPTGMHSCLLHFFVFLKMFKE